MEKSQGLAEITIYNRKKQIEEVEKIYGEGFLRWLYQTPMGKNFTSVLVHPLLSRAYGLFQDLPLSQRKITPFIKKFQIPMEDFLPHENRTKENPYLSFNEFFIRRFKEGKRHFHSDSNRLSAFAEGRFLAYESVNLEEKFPVKGKFLTAKKILKNRKWASVFEGGPLMVARLCPVDYHRFHFPDEGEIVDYFKVPGQLHSVNPLALSQFDEVFCENERQVSILATKNFGYLAYVEVGAICVGKIVQTKVFEKKLKFKEKNHFQRGEEKGYFLFGGSTVILLGEKGKWLPDEDILIKTKNQRETFIELGDSVGRKLES